MTDVVPGYGPAAIAAEALRQELLIRTLLLGVRTAMPVKVVAVHPGQGFPPGIGTVDVEPLVQTVDGSGKLWALGATYGAPFLRPQAGGNAVIMDPQVGDIGLAVACDRDISSVLASGGAVSGPGSTRTHDVSDLVYLMSLISIAALAQYIWFDGQNLTLLSPGTLSLQGQQIKMNGATVSSSGEITDAAGVALGTHEHSAGTLVAPGGGGAVTGDTGAPT